MLVLDHSVKLVFVINFKRIFVLVLINVCHSCLVLVNRDIHSCYSYLKYQCAYVQVWDVHPDSSASHCADRLRRLCQHSVQCTQCILYGARRHEPVQRHAAVNPPLQVLQEGTLAESHLWSSQHQQCLGHFLTLVMPCPIPSGKRGRNSLACSFSVTPFSLLLRVFVNFRQSSIVLHYCRTAIFLIQVHMLLIYLSCSETEVKCR